VSRVYPGTQEVKTAQNLEESAMSTKKDSLYQKKLLIFSFIFFII